EVPPFFLVRNPVGVPPTAPAPQATDVPEFIGKTFGGTRKDVTIDQVIAANGPRNPAPGPRPPLRQAFIYVDAGGSDAATSVARLDPMRTAWEAFFAQLTEGRRSADTHLN